MEASLKVLQGAPRQKRLEVPELLHDCRDREIPQNGKSKGNGAKQSAWAERDGSGPCFVQRIGTGGEAGWGDLPLGARAGAGRRCIGQQVHEVAGVPVAGVPVVGA